MASRNYRANSESYIEAVELAKSDEFDKTFGFCSVHSYGHADDIEFFFEESIDFISLLVSEQPNQFVNILPDLLVLSSHDLIIGSSRSLDDTHPSIDLLSSLDAKQMDPVLHLDLEAVLRLDLHTVRYHHVNSEDLS